MNVIPNDRIVEAFKAAGLDVEEWHTGGGCMNVAVVLRRGGSPTTYDGVPDGTRQADRWLMFCAGGFHPDEPVVGLYDENEGHLAGPRSGEPVREWDLSDVRTLAALVARTREIVAEAAEGGPT